MIPYSHKIKTPNASAPLTVALMREHLNFYEVSTEVDTLLAFFMQVAESRIEKLTGKPFGQTTYTYKLDRFPCEIRLPRGPVSSVVHVKYKAASTGIELTLDQSTDIEIDKDSIPARIRPRYGKQWPQVYPVFLPIEIEYIAGSTPEPELLAALRLMVATWFSNREALVGKAADELPEPFGFSALIRDHVLEPIV